jgi:hypothetical protein
VLPGVTIDEKSALACIDHFFVAVGKSAWAFVECMAPCVKTSYLKSTILPRYKKWITGWGTDLIWAQAVASTEPGGLFRNGPKAFLSNHYQPF